MANKVLIKDDTEILKIEKSFKDMSKMQSEFITKLSQYADDHPVLKAPINGSQLFFRPIKSTDNKLLQDLASSVSIDSIAFQPFQPIKAFPHIIIQNLTNIDYSKDMAIGAIAHENGEEQIVGIAYYKLNQGENGGEISLLVREDWQKKGVSSYLLEVITEIAKRRGIVKFDAIVYKKRKKIFPLFYNSGHEVSIKELSNVYKISYKTG